MTYEITIRYEGANHYLVEAEDAEAAEKLARERYQDGDNGEQTGAEWEEITRIMTEELDQQ